MSEPQNPVRRHVRRLDVWAVTKVSLLFFAVVGIIWLVTALVLWRVLHAFDLVSRVEELSGQLVGGDFRLRGSQLLRAFLLLDVIWVLGSTVFAVILAITYNLITDVVGGLSFVVEDKVSKRDRTVVGALRSRLRRPRGRETKAKPAAKPAGKRARPAKPQAVPGRRQAKPAAAGTRTQPTRARPAATRSGDSRKQKPAAAKTSAGEDVAPVPADAKSRKKQSATRPAAQSATVQEKSAQPRRPSATVGNPSEAAAQAPKKKTSQPSAGPAVKPSNAQDDSSNGGAASKATAAKSKDST